MFNRFLTIDARARVVAREPHLTHSIQIKGTNAEWEVLAHESSVHKIFEKQISDDRTKSVHVYRIGTPEDGEMWLERFWTRPEVGDFYVGEWKDTMKMSTTWFMETDHVYMPDAMWIECRSSGWKMVKRGLDGLWNSYEYVGGSAVIVNHDGVMEDTRRDVLDEVVGILSAKERELGVGTYAQPDDE